MIREGRTKMQKLTGIWASAEQGHLWHSEVCSCSTAVPIHGLIILRGMSQL